MMDFAESWWEEELQRRRVVAHYTWRMRIGCFESRLDFVEKLIWRPSGSGKGSVKSCSPPSMTMEYISSCYEELKRNMMVFLDSGNVWIGNNNRNGAVREIYSVDFLQKRNDAQAYSASNVSCAYHSFKVCARRNELLTDRWYRLVGFLPACCTQEQLEDEEGVEAEEMSVYGSKSTMTVPLTIFVRLTAHLVVRERQMRILHKTMEVVVGPPQKCELRGIVVKIRKCVGRKSEGYWYRTAVVYLNTKICQRCDTVLH